MITIRTHCFTSKAEMQAAFENGTAQAMMDAWNAYTARIENADTYVAGYIACSKQLGVELDPTQIEAARAEYIGTPDVGGAQ